MTTLRAFFLGIREFRLTTTPHFPDLAHAEAYDRGREFAHRFTLRLFEQR